jgi:hypothetical protein
MSFGPREYIAHILDECDFLVQSLADLELEQFLASAVLRCVKESQTKTAALRTGSGSCS